MSTASSTAASTAAYVLASSAVGVIVLALLLTRAVLFQLNPGGLDLTDPAAYEVELWVPCALVALALAAAIGVVFGRLRRAGGDLRYPALILQLQVGITIAAVALLLLTPGIGL